MFLIGIHILFELKLHNRWRKIYNLKIENVDWQNISDNFRQKFALLFLMFFLYFEIVFRKVLASNIHFILYSNRLDGITKFTNKCVF